MPLIRAIELLESHFERGGGVLVAVQARLARRQLARVTSEVSVRWLPSDLGTAACYQGLIEYSLQIPSTATRAASNQDWRQQQPSKWGSDVDWILAGEEQ